MRKQPYNNYLVTLLFTLTLGMLGVGRGYAQHTYEIEEIKDDGVDRINHGVKLQGFLLDPYLGTPYQAPIDTVYTGYYRHVQAESRSIAIGYLGNIGSPWHNKSFFDRSSNFFAYPFISCFDQMVYDYKNTFFYNTKVPYSKLFYQRNGAVTEREEEVDFTLALNLNRHIGLGADFDYKYSSGYYIGNRTKNLNYRVFTNFIYDRYEAYVSVGNNTYTLTENGGIKDDQYITNPSALSRGRNSLEAHDIPVNAPKSVWNEIGLWHFKLFHRYNLGSYKRRSHDDHLTAFNEERPVKDSLNFIPIATISHYLNFKHGRRTYINSNSNSIKSYPNHHSMVHTRQEGLSDSIYFNPIDSTYMWQLDNTIALSMREGFRKWVVAGMDAYVRFENKHYMQSDSVGSQFGHHNAFNTVIGGKISRTKGERLNFNALGEFTIVGENIGNTLIEGGIRSQIATKQFPVNLSVNGHFSNLRPNYFLRHYHGSFHWWDNDFGYERTLRVDGGVNLPKFGTEVNVYSSLLQNKLYFNSDALPVQESSPIQIYAAEISHKYKWGILAWDLKGMWQYSSNPRAIPLPMISAFGALYADFLIAKVMSTQLGLDCTIHSPYFVPAYEPATMQFINQNEIKYGWFPHINLFANMKISRVRFFVQYFNAGDMLIKPSQRFSLRSYPINPSSIRFGLCFDFNN